MTDKSVVKLCIDHPFADRREKNVWSGRGNGRSRKEGKERDRAGMTDSTLRSREKLN
jgi:hypothetical protein